MSNPVNIDQTVIGWLLASAGAFILFLLGLGVNDLRAKMKKTDLLCIRLTQLEQRLESDIARRLDRLEDHIDKEKN
jgi:hypothetical protein